ncbi:hypothetical protein MMC06_006282, partial [Schaereria dolodes]|nr:hypothetical protein [Schaereria dolodes]
FLTCIEEAKGSAAALVNLLVEYFPCFRDEARFEGKTIRFYKRAQILVADLWACFDGEGHGRFDDIDKITMFAGMPIAIKWSIETAHRPQLDYRIPQMLYLLGCLSYSPPLEHHIRQKRPIKTAHSWEVQLRGCSIWCIELIRREIIRHHPEAKINAVLIDFFLYDTIKGREESGLETIPHHRTRSIWY